MHRELESEWLLELNGNTTLALSKVATTVMLFDSPKVQVQKSQPLLSKLTKELGLGIS